MRNNHCYDKDKDCDKNQYRDQACDYNVQGIELCGIPFVITAVSNAYK